MKLPNHQLNKEIVIKHKKGVTFSQLSKHYGRTKSTLHGLYHRYKNDYLLPEEKKAVRI